MKLAPPLAEAVRERVEAVADPARLVVVSCSSLPDSERALDELRGLEVNLRDAAIVARTEAGRLELRQTNQVAAGEGIVAGGTVGFVAGMLLGGPVGGALLGMLGGIPAPSSNLQLFLDRPAFHTVLVATDCTNLKLFRASAKYKKDRVKS